jgi:hypothetical protein
MLLLLAAGIAAPLLGCGSSNTDTNTTTGIKLLNENNYSSESQLHLDSMDTVSGDDLDITWDKVTENLLKQSISPTSDIKELAFLKLPNKTHDQAQESLLSGDLQLGKTVEFYYEFETNGKTETTLSSMHKISEDTRVVLGESYKEDSSSSYVLMASGSASPGTGARSMIFITPKAGSDNKTVNMPSGKSQLEFQIDLKKLAKVAVSTKGPWVMDWSHVTEDSEGKEIVWQNQLAAYELIVGYYDKTVSELENDPMNLDKLATKMWKIKNIDTETSKNLALAQATDDGSLFKGFDQAKDKLWAFGLVCPNCQNPAPMFFTILDLSD